MEITPDVCFNAHHMMGLQFFGNIFCNARHLAALALLGCAFAATAAPLREQVVAVEGAQLRLAQTGTVQLADLYFPDKKLGEQWLITHLLQQPMAFTPAGESRYGVVQVRSDAAIAMLRDGAALVFSTQQVPAEYLHAEALARAENRGIWSNPTFFVTTRTIAAHLGNFAMLEGTITHTYKGRSAIYLNFGDDWKTDCSVMIPRRALRSFKQLDALREGTRVRVRGVVFEQNGPMIEVNRPELLEVL